MIPGGGGIPGDSRDPPIYFENVSGAIIFFYMLVVTIIYSGFTIEIDGPRYRAQLLFKYSHEQDYLF